MDENSKGGFIHSVKVPRLYKAAAKIVQEVAEGGGSVKQLVFEKKHFNVNALYALVSLTLQKVHEINFLFKRTQLLQKEPRFDPWLARILVTELLWGSKKTLPQNNCKPIQTISGYEQIFKSHLSDNTGLFSEETQEKKPKKKPRYVRINTVLISFEEALDHFTEEGWILDNEFDKKDYRGFLQRVENLHGDYFIKDIHVPNLLIFPSGTKFFDHFGYKNGWIILQDKASCLPVHILNPPPGSTVLDMCAAPGMKTTQLASVLNNEGEIYAVERDKRRYESLVKMVESSGATNIKTLNKDILQCSPEDFPNVEYILVDPSCSGSGMTDRVQFQEEQSNARLERLSGFQIKILRSAMSKYPNAKRVVYSTCSVHPEENEDVVRQVLETNYLFKLVDAKTIIKESWLNFGSSDFGELGEFCLYAKPEQDLTNGFFVAVFDRLKEGEVNQFFDNQLFNYKKKLEVRNKNREARFLQRQKEFEKQYGPVGKKTENDEVNSDYNSEDKKNQSQNHEKTNTKNVEDNIENNDTKKKKRKHKQSETGLQVDNENIETEITKEHSKKKTSDLMKKRKHIEPDVGLEELQADNGNIDTENNGTKKKKRKHKKSEKNIETEITNEHSKKKTSHFQDEIKSNIELNGLMEKTKHIEPDVGCDFEIKNEPKTTENVQDNIERKKKKEKRKEPEVLIDKEVITENLDHSSIKIETDRSEKKHKHSKIEVIVNLETLNAEMEPSQTKKHKTQNEIFKNINTTVENTDKNDPLENESPSKRKKAKKYKTIILESEDEQKASKWEINIDAKKKRKKNKHLKCDKESTSFDHQESVNDIHGTSKKKSKKDKHLKCNSESTSFDHQESVNDIHGTPKKKSKKAKKRFSKLELE